jgi:bla regulator protein blaR1
MLTVLSFHTPLLQSLGWTLVHSPWQGALIAALSLFVNLFVKPSHPRYIMACAALLLMLVSPSVTFGLLYKTPLLLLKIKPCLRLKLLPM